MKSSFLLFVFSQVVLSRICMAMIRLYNYSHIVLELQDYSTGLEPHFPMEGLRGKHLYLNVPDPCSPDLPRPPPDVNIFWFALLDFREECYQNQILNIQLAGYKAAILSKNFEDDEDDERENLDHGRRGAERSLAGRTRNIIAMERNDTLNIPSTIVSNTTKYILVAFARRPNITMVIYPEFHDINKFMLILLGTLCLAVVAALFLTGVMYGCYRVYKVRKSIVTKWKLKLLPTHVFQKGDSYEVCVICLDEYIEGAKLRILSCGHAFHCKCVDPWLVKSGRECPLCKRKADLGRSRNKRSRGDDYDVGADSSAEERAALLGNESRDNFDGNDDDDDDNPVRILPEGQTTINAIVHSSEHQESSNHRSLSSHRNYGTTGAIHSNDGISKIPEVVIRSTTHNEPYITPPNPTNGGQDRLALSRPLAACPPGEQSRATFYIGSVATDDGCLLDAPEGTQVAAEKVVAPVQKVGSECEDSEEDFYDVI